MKVILLTLLIVSLAFNVFFTVGFFQACKQEDKARTLEGRARIMAEKLKLDQQQYKVFETLLAEFTKLRQTRAAQRDAFFAELVKDQPNEKMLEDLCAGDSVKQYRLDMLALMRKFIGMLHPQQRETFLEIIRNRNSSDRVSATPPGK